MTQQHDDGRREGGLLIDDMDLTLDDLCRAAGVEPEWLRARVAEGLIVHAAPDGSVSVDRFQVAQVQRVRRMHRVERDFDAVPELAALVADLFDEIDRLRARLRRAGLA